MSEANKKDKMVPVAVITKPATKTEEAIIPIDDKLIGQILSSADKEVGFCDTFSELKEYDERLTKFARDVIGDIYDEFDPANIIPHGSRFYTAPNAVSHAAIMPATAITGFNAKGFSGPMTMVMPTADGFRHVGPIEDEDGNIKMINAGLVQAPCLVGGADIDTHNALLIPLNGPALVDGMRLCAHFIDMYGNTGYPTPQQDFPIWSDKD